MYSGYLTKRSAPISPPPMQKMFCVLWGTMLFDYDSEEDAKNSMCPKVVTEILGISEWDGKGRANSYPFGFLLVTHTGGTYYVSVPTVKDRDEWILHVKRALECIFANPDVVPFKPSKIIQNRPSLASNMVCPRSHHTLSASGTYYCKACGRGYYSSEYISETSTMLQIGVEDSEKVCLDCKNAQLVVLWIKSLNYAHVMNLHEMTPQVLSDVNKFKNSFKLRRRLSSRLEMAADLWTQGNISAEEFEELRNVDHAYRRELVYEESRRLKSAVDAFGEDMQTILGILMNPHLTDPGGRTSYYNIVLRILEIADNSPDLIDFYFPQIIQVHLQETRLRTMESLVKVDLLQQALLVIAQKYPALGLKLAWSLLASVGDYAEKRVTQAQYAACTCLLLQLEIAVTGVVSSIADVPACRLLSKVFRGSAHQQQEIGFEISALFLVRRRLQEVFDEEEERRRVRTTNRYSTEGDDEIGETVVITSPANSPAPPSEKERKASRQTGKKHNKRHSYSNKEITCLDLLYQLGVGQAGGSQVRAASAPSFSYVSDADSDDDADYEVSGSDEENTGESGGSGAPNPKCHRPSLNNFTTHQWSGFAEQLDFLDRVNDVVEGLRFIDRTARTEALVKEVTKWNEEPLRFLGWDPTTIAGEPHYRITRIITEECRVFRTKARAPSMLVCEVVRDDLASQGHYANNHVCAPTDSESTAGLDLSLEGGSDREKDALGESIPDNTSSNIDNTHSNNHSNVSNSSCHQLVSVGSSDSMSASGPTLVHTKLIAERPGDEKVSDQLSQIEELVGSSMTHTIAELHKHETHTHEKQLQLDVGSGLPLARSQSLKTSPVNIAGKHKSTATAGMSSRISNSSLVDIAHGSSSSSSHSARPASMVMPKRKTSTFLSSNRLAVNAEDMMRSTTSSPSNTVGAALKLSAVALHSSNAQNNMNLAQSNTGGAHNSPAFRMTHSGKFKPGSVPSSSGVASLSGQGSDEDTGSVLNDSDNASLSSFSQDDTVSVRSSGTATQETAQVTKKVLTSAQRLLQSGKIDAKEYEQLLASDMQYHEETAREEAQIAKCRVESAFGESWLSKKEKYLGDRMHVHHAAHEGAGHFVASINGGFEVEDEGMVDPTDWPAWDLRCFIVKSNDDLRQEVCCLQLMQLCKEVFEHFGLSQMLWLKPYRIISTGATTGIVHVLTDAASLDALKKTPGFTTLNNYFKKTYDSSAERLAQAKRNFTTSLAAYSLFSYILLIKDRHNGNLMIDAEGHIIHIDFGFLLSIAPGGSFSVETAPFKLTEEMVEVMGGLDSPLFGEFVNAFTKGFIALQANAENIVGALQIISLNSTFPCFAGKQASVIIDKLRQRFRTELSVGDAVKHCLDLITNSYGNYGTRQYDTFQYLTNGIFP